MRDGVRLVRIVEIVLLSRNPNSSAAGDDCSISGQLKFPALSRAQKIHNVSLALGALDPLIPTSPDISAKDIVDGFREKTVGLLWTILARWGLPVLIDWGQVKKEIQRYEQNLPSAEKTILPDRGIEGKDTEYYTELLKAWARSIAAIHGLAVNNLTTSFADGRVFGKIVEEYERYFPLGLVGKEASLEEKLRAIGCSPYFGRSIAFSVGWAVTDRYTAKLFGEQLKAGKVFNEDFIVAGLAYLCSRLLQWSVNERVWHPFMHIDTLVIVLIVPIA